MIRLFLMLSALVAVLSAPVAAPAMAAAMPMEHCADGHAAPPAGDHERMAMDHLACCIAVDPGENRQAPEILWAGSVPRTPILGNARLSSASGTDPPPPRLG